MKKLVVFFLILLSTSAWAGEVDPKVIPRIECSELLTALTRLHGGAAGLTGEVELKNLFARLPSYEPKFLNDGNLAERLVLPINVYPEALQFVNAYLDFMNGVVQRPLAEQKEAFHRTEAFFALGLFYVGTHGITLGEPTALQRRNLGMFNTIASSPGQPEKLSREITKLSPEAAKNLMQNVTGLFLVQKLMTLLEAHSSDAETDQSHDRDSGDGSI